MKSAFGFEKSLTGGAILNLKAGLDNPQWIDGGGCSDACDSSCAQMHSSPNISITAAKCRFCLRVSGKINGACRHNRAEQRPDLSDMEVSKSGANDANIFKMKKGQKGCENSAHTPLKNPRKPSAAYTRRVTVNKLDDACCATDLDWGACY